MTRVLLLLALITLAAAQFNQNFTQVLLEYGSQGILVVPENITDKDGTTYFDLQKVLGHQPDGTWIIDLIQVDGSRTQLRNIANNLVLISPSGDVTNIADQLPSIVGINGARLVAAVNDGVERGVASVYSPNGPTRVTTAQANLQANTVVNQVLSTSSLPSFFLTPIKAQAGNQILSSLRNAQKVSAAVNATAEAQNPPPVVTPPVDTPPAQTNDTQTPPAQTNDTQTPPPADSNSVLIPLNLSSFNNDSLDNVKEIDVSYGKQLVVATLEDKAEDANGEDIGYVVDIETLTGEDNVNNEWQLQWVTKDGNAWNIFDVNNSVYLVANDLSQQDITETAAAWLGTDNAGADEALTNAVENFVNVVFENANKTDKVVVNLENDGLRWTYANGTAQATPQPVADPAPQPVADPVTEPVADPVPEPVADPAPQTDAAPQPVADSDDNGVVPSN